MRQETPRQPSCYGVTVTPCPAFAPRLLTTFTLGTIDSVIDREAQRFPLGATLVLITSRMDPAIATSLLRVSHSGHAVTVLSLAEQQDVAAMLPGIKVFDLSQVMPSTDFARR